MKIWETILLICIWQAIGFGGWVILGSSLEVRVIKYAMGIEFVNPLVIYKHTKVNWFGAIVLALIYGAMCPIATIGYWFYKLCTAGRKV